MSAAREGQIRALVEERVYHDSQASAAEDVELLLRLLDEVPAEIRRLRAPAAVWEQRIGALQAEIDRFRAPMDAAAMERAKRAFEAEQLAHLRETLGSPSLFPRMHEPQ